MIRFYLIPVEVNVIAGRTYRGAKYFPSRYDPDPPALIQMGDNGQPIRAEMRDYGDEPSLLIASNTSDADDATLAALPDVTKFADNLDQQVGAQLATMQAALEALNLPAQMVTANTTHRQVIRGIMGIFDVAQCMQGKGFRVFGAAITLSTTLSTLSVPARQALQACATERGYDQTGITLASTIRQVLTLIVQQAARSTMLGISV